VDKASQIGTLKKDAAATKDAPRIILSQSANYLITFRVDNTGFSRAVFCVQHPLLFFVQPMNNLKGAVEVSGRAGCEFFVSSGAVFWPVIYPLFCSYSPVHVSDKVKCLPIYRYHSCFHTPLGFA